MKKMRALTTGSLIALTMMVGSVEATFQHWESKAFEPGESEREARTERRQERTKDTEEAQKLMWEESREHYYEEIAPKDMERQHDYLLQDHPLQEDPLPDKPVE